MASKKVNHSQETSIADGRRFDVIFWKKNEQDQKKYLPQKQVHNKKSTLLRSTVSDPGKIQEFVILASTCDSKSRGFYHSAIINSHDINGSEQLWDLAKRIHNSFSNTKNNNNHFKDMADLNFRMCRAIENPGLTHCSSLRTSVISVFEDPVFDYTNGFHHVIGLQDYIGCALVHSVGPSIAFFDTVHEGALDCACVYPAPLHSRD